jgi:hypothetical protein
MERLERKQKRLHILQTKLGTLNDTELAYIKYLKQELESLVGVAS